LAIAEPLTLNGAGILNGGVLTNNSVTPVTYSGTIALNSASTIGTLGNITSTGIISGANVLTKVGAGTLKLSGSNTFSGGLIISTGVVELGSADRLVNTLPVSLNGGTLSTGSSTGYGDVAGTLTLSNNSTLELGSGSHTLTFSASNGVSWDGSSMLTIKYWAGLDNGTSGTDGKVFVGSDVNGLTPAQVAQIQFFYGGSNIPAIMLPTGEVVPFKTPTILTGTISGSSFCAGETVSVPFTKAGTYTSGNIFTAQLSNSGGLFSSPVAIGTLSSTASGSITATIPINTASGSGYRIRVVSSTPNVTGTDNGSDLKINALPVIGIFY